MIETYAIGIVGITGLMITWVIVQKLWKRAFSDQYADADVLAARSDCGSCGCSSPCVNKRLELKK